MSHTSARDALEAARSAANGGEHELERYAWFFDNCLALDQSFYGVRLSYVLDEWAELGRKFAPAKKALEEKLRQTREDVANALSHARFHDLVSISRALDQPTVVVEAFRQLHADNPQAAAKVFSLAWETLYEAGEIELCSICIAEPSKLYAGLVRNYDESLALARPEWNGFEQWVVAHFRNQATMLLDILRRADREAEAQELASRFEKDSQDRSLG